MTDSGDQTARWRLPLVGRLVLPHTPSWFCDQDAGHSARLETSLPEVLLPEVLLPEVLLPGTLLPGILLPGTLLPAERLPDERLPDER